MNVSTFQGLDVWRWVNTYSKQVCVCLCTSSSGRVEEFYAGSDLGLPQHVEPIGRSLLPWKKVSIDEDMPLHVFQPRMLGKDKSNGWYYLIPWGSHVPFVVRLHSSIKGTKESWFWVWGKWQTIEEDKVPVCTVPTRYYEARECFNLVPLFLIFHNLF